MRANRRPSSAFAVLITCALAILLASGCRLERDSEAPSGGAPVETEEERQEREEDELEAQALSGGEANATHLNDGRVISPTYVPVEDEAPQPFWGHEGDISAVTFNVRGDLLYTAAPGRRCWVGTCARGAR